MGIDQQVVANEIGGVLLIGRAAARLARGVKDVLGLVLPEEGIHRIGADEIGLIFVEGIEPFGTQAADNGRAFERVHARDVDRRIRSHEHPPGRSSRSTGHSVTKWAFLIKAESGGERGRPS